MFNLSKLKKQAVHEEWKAPADEKVPEDLKKEHNFHKTIRQRLDQQAGPLAPGQPDLLSNEATRFVIMMLKKNPDDVDSISLKDVMGEYYYYLKKFDNAYLKELSDVVSELKRKPEHVKRIMETLSAGPQQAAPGGMAPQAAPQAQPPPQPGQDFGIANIPLGMTASGNDRIVTSKLFLKGPGKKHVMSDSLLGRILSGEVHLIRPSGETVSLGIKDDEIIVPRSSAAAALSIKLEEELPSIVCTTISDFLKKSDIPDSDFMARSITERFCKNGSIDLRPISVLLGNSSLGILLYDDVPGIMEDPKVHKLRKELGKRMGPLIDSLKSALSMEGVDVVERDIAMPEHTEIGKRQRHRGSKHSDRHPTRDPSVLDPEKLKKSMDVSSIVMTAADTSSKPEVRGLALDRLVELIAAYPEVYGKNKLSIEDMHYISKSANNNILGPKLERIQKFIGLFESDDDFLIRTYAESSEDDRRLISKLVAKQERQDVIDANPEMCLAGWKLNPEFLSRIDPTKNESLIFLTKLVGLRNNGQIKIHRLLDLKIAEAIYKTKDSNLIAEALKSGSSLPYLALSVMLERGDEKDLSVAVEKLKNLPTGHYVSDVTKNLLAATFAKTVGQNNPEVMNLVRKILGAKPAEVANLAGKTVGLAFMRSTRSDWNGDEVPDASKLFSLSDDPLSLAKSYKQLAESGDPGAKAGLHRLMHLLSQKLSENEDEQLRYALQYVKESLSKLGEESSFIDALSLPESKPVEAQLLPDGSVLRKKAGRYYVDDVSVCFSSKPQECELWAIREISKARKQGI